MSSDIREQIVEMIPRLRRFSRSLTGNIYDADDLVQTGIEKALYSINRYQPGTRLDSWLFRIIKNIWIDQIRSLKARGISVELNEAAILSGEDGRKTNEEKLLLRQTEAAIAQLPEEQRCCVALVLVEGLSYREAAQILELPIGTVMSRLARARKSLAIQLQLGDDQ